MKKLAIAAAAAAALIAFAPAGRSGREPARREAEPPSRPNVVLLLAEGATPRALGAEHGVRTPNLDRLLARGRPFDHAYAQYPMAGPSRASLLTGWRPERTGVWGEPEGRIGGATPLQEHFHA